MVINEVQLITFSPTGTSRRVGEAIVDGTGISAVKKVDLTLEPVDMPDVQPDTLTVITVPVYGGHVAPLAMERLNTLHSENSPVVLVAVYGNRDYEKALTDLQTLVLSHGFKVIACATFIGEHSYSNEKFPIAAGRPDADDLAFARSFGERIGEKIVAAPDMERLAAVNVTRIKRPRQSFIHLLRFIGKVVKLRKSGVAMPRTPEVDAELCSHCGYCAVHCPAGAIVKGDECHADNEKCIKCCACVKGCPKHARVYDTPFAAMLSDCFSKNKENHVLL
ncbi:MAG: 4Fe-4S binding protein [Muribaculum sp.]|nr:4Fe-4S binding protein [Muribaculum sp.]